MLAKPTKEPNLVIFPNHLLPVLGLPSLHRLLLQLMLARLQLPLALYPRARAHLVLGHVVHVREEALQVADAVFERVGRGAVLRVCVFGIGTLVSGFGCAGEGARFLGVRRLKIWACGRLIMLALL